MSTQPRTVSAKIRMQLAEPVTYDPIPVTLHYTTADPFALHATFHTASGGEAVEWLFGRELLSDGLVSKAGRGDVTIWPAPGDGDRIYLQLLSPSGRAVFDASRDALTAFLSSTFDVVPPGQESDYVDVDSELDLLLHQS